MFFIASADEHGRPNCSYKGGDPGFVRVVDEHTIAFPNYDGNGMYLTMGNLVRNPAVGILFIDFERGRRMRLNGDASINPDDELMKDYPEAQLIVRVRARAVFPNCPRYIHRYERAERSRFVPEERTLTPVPQGLDGIASTDQDRSKNKAPHPGDPHRRTLRPPASSR
jgi:hypothetical protein